MYCAEQHPEVDVLREENTRLISLLESHGIEWRLPPPPAAPPPEPEPSRLTTGQKVALFRRLFRGRSDVYPVRWESKTTGKTGYSPACANEWLAGVCDKPRIKCGDCSKRLLIPLSDSVIYNHLAGEHTVGVYPLLEDDTRHFLAVHFDEAEWRDDARAFIQSCEELGVPGPPWRFPGQARARTPGCSSPARFRPAMPVASAPPTSAIPASVPGN